jgi:MYXO-CTERM domain-containing protein
MIRPTYALIAIACATAAPAASAALIGLDLLDSPDIASTFITTNYDGAGGLTASGFASEYDDDGTLPADPIAGGTFDLDATLTPTGMATAGSLTIGGSVGGFGPSLLTGDLLDFGFLDAGGMILEFVFSVTGGDLAGAYGGLGAEFGVILDVRDGGYSGDWTQSFSTIAGVADTAPVPGPAVAALFALAAVGARRRRR